MADKNMEAQINIQFEEATSRQSLNSGDNISNLIGKIQKWLIDLDKVAFSGQYSDLSGVPIHSGTSEYWNSQKNLIGEKSHIYIYTDYATVNTDSGNSFVPNIKIGDGSAYLIDNPFITSSVEQLMQLHITDTVKHITEQERNNWNSKVRCYLSSEDNENIIFTTN